jgi:hypothetical protein
MILGVNSDHLLHINQVMLVMVKYGVLFEVRTEFLILLAELRLQSVNNQ